MIATTSSGQGRIVVLALALAGTAALAVASPGDPRSGYERPEFRTQSRRVVSDAAVPAPRAGEFRPLPQEQRLGLPDPLPYAWPDAAVAALGRRLFFDRRLSGNATLSCAMCHVPEQAFTQNEVATSVGFQGRVVRRNAPTLLNVALLPELFHDGREHSLELQVWSPLLAANEMGNPSMGAVVRRVGRIPAYVQAFRTAFGGPVSAETLGRALAAYQRTLLAADSAFDRWYYGGDVTALSAAARRGFRRFREHGCSGCHRVGERWALFTDHGYHDTGLGYYATMLRPDQPARVQIAPGVFVPLNTALPRPRPRDLGRYELTGQSGDRWRYRTPALRNVALTAPYMHDGSLPTLAAVLDHYDRGGTPHPDQDPRIRPLGLTPAERADLLAFLESLTGSHVAALVATARRQPVGDVGGAAAAP